MKLAFTLPALALLLSSCNSKGDEQYFMGQISTSAAIQKEIYDPEFDTVKTVFVPNIVAQAVSDASIINPMI